MSVKTKAFAVAVLAGLVTPAIAADAPFTKRWYIGAAGGASTLEPDPNGTSFTVTDDSSSGGKFVLGYDLNENFSVEGHFADLGTAGLTPESEIDYSVAGLSAVWYAANNWGKAGKHRREGLSLFFRAGVGSMSNSATGVTYKRENDAHFAIGLGLEGHLASGFSVRLGYDSYDEDAQFATLGFVKRFGKIKEPEPEKVVIIQEPEPEPAPVAETVAVVDSDGDGVTDDLDVCPDTRPGEKVDTRGCVFGGVLDGVNFHTASAELTRQARAVLDGVIQEMIRYPDVRVEIQAHTDNQGRDQYNLNLSEQRARSVLDYLTERGVDPARLSSKGYGESQPAYRNDTEEGRRKNRRVEFKVLDR